MPAVGARTLHLDVSEINDPDKVRAPKGKFRMFFAEWEDPQDLQHRHDFDVLVDAIHACERNHRFDDTYIFNDRGEKVMERFGTKAIPT